MKKTESLIEEVETVKDLELTNMEAVNLFKLYSKIIHADFNNLDEALVVANEAVKIEDTVKGYSKLEEVIINKVKGKHDLSEEETIKINKSLQELGNKKVKIQGGITPIPKETLNTIKMKPVEVMLLQRLNLY